MASSLPIIPRLTFTVLEPLSLLGGFVGAVADPAWFVAEQIPFQAIPTVVTENSIMLAWQLGNLYLLMALVGLAVLNSTSEVKVVHGYLWALWLGDIGHVAFTCYGLGPERLSNPWGWNAMTFGNVAFTVFLFLMRSAYFAGVFGRDKVPNVSAIKKSS